MLAHFMWRDELYLQDIVEATNRIAAFLSGANKTQFEDWDFLRFAISKKLEVIREAAQKGSTPGELASAQRRSL